MSSSPSSLLNRAEGRSLTDIARNGLGGWLLAVATAAITGLQAMLELLLTPITLLTELMAGSVRAFFLEPFGIVETGAETTANAVSDFGILGLVVAVGIVLGTFLIIIRYLNERETTDVPIPGLAVDVIPWVGVEEEADADD